MTAFDDIMPDDWETLPLVVTYRHIRQLAADPNENDAMRSMLGDFADWMADNRFHSDDELLHEATATAYFRQKAYEEHKLSADSELSAHISWDDYADAKLNGLTAFQYTYRGQYSILNGRWWLLLDLQ